MKTTIWKIPLTNSKRKLQLKRKKTNPSKNQPNKIRYKRYEDGDVRVKVIVIVWIELKFCCKIRNKTKWTIKRRRRRKSIWLRRCIKLRRRGSHTL